MASVVVTGGSGKAGSAIIRELLNHGHAVMNVDVVPPAEPLCHFFKADLSDPGCGGRCAAAGGGHHRPAAHAAGRCHLL